MLVAPLPPAERPTRVSSHSSSTLGQQSPSLLVLVVPHQAPLPQTGASSSDPPGPSRLPCAPRGTRHPSPRTAPHPTPHSSRLFSRSTPQPDLRPRLASVVSISTMAARHTHTYTHTSHTPSSLEAPQSLSTAARSARTLLSPLSSLSAPCRRAAAVLHGAGSSRNLAGRQCRWR